MSECIVRMEMPRRCAECPIKVEGREDALSNYFNGIIGNYEQDKKIMKERYGVEL